MSGSGRVLACSRWLCKALIRHCIWNQGRGVLRICRESIISCLSSLHSPARADHLRAAEAGSVSQDRRDREGARCQHNPVREGLLLLQSEAYVRLIPRRGFVVNSFSRQDLFDLFWAQATLAAELCSDGFGRGLLDATNARFRRLRRKSG